MADRRAVFVVNPASDGGRTGKKWPEIADAARRHGLEVVERLTESAGHATVLAREAVAAGEELVVAVGGDGTVNEVVNGFFDESGTSLGGAAALGVIERGTGCDFVRTFGIPKKTDRAVATIAAGKRRRIDIGRATCQGPAGPQVRMFANIASCGMSGAVAERANATSKRLGGTPAFLFATVATFAGWRNVEFHVRADDTERVLVANNVVCANCRYFGGGMKIAPDAPARRRAARRDPGRRHLEGRLRAEPAPPLPRHPRPAREGRDPARPQDRDHARPDAARGDRRRAAGDDAGHLRGRARACSI